MAYLGYCVRREFVVDGGRSNGKRPLSWSWSVLWKRKCREKRKREREASIPRVTWKTNKALYTGLVPLTKAQGVISRRS